MIQRTTELRHLEAKQVHEISLILNENDGWKRVMGAIPKKIEFSYSYDNSVDWEKLTEQVGYKYSNDEIRKIETPRIGDSRLPAEIFIDEWSTSGKKENRATVGMFLQLLVKSELFRAADLVAQKWLGEEAPKRPSTGPAARINISLPSEFLNEVASYAGDSAFQPDTEDLHINESLANGKLENNQDFYTKFRYENKNWSTNDCNVPPMPAPRRNRKSERLHSQEQIANHQSTIDAANAATTATMNGSLNGSEREKTTPASGATASTEISTTQQLPLLPVFFPQLNSNNVATSNSSGTTVSTTIESSSAPIPLLSALQEPAKSDSIMTDFGDLPAISALNLNGQHDNEVQSENHIKENQQNGGYANELDDDDSNDVDDDNEENSLSKMGSSNNDSSLTNVTGTSGENSFELSSSSTSNENIPLNVLQY